MNHNAQFDNLKKLTVSGFTSLAILSIGLMAGCTSKKNPEPPPATSSETLTVPAVPVIASAPAAASAAMGPDNKFGTPAPTPGGARPADAVPAGN
jgi:hypothetical protein